MDAENAPNPAIFNYCVLALNFLGLETFGRLGNFYSDVNFPVTVLFLVQFVILLATLILFQLRRKTTVTRHV